MRAFFAALVLSLLLSGAAFADTPMTGNDVRSIVTAANQGSGVAQFQLGVMLLTGTGVAKDPNKAGAWLIRAANQGVSGAQYELAKLQIAGTAPGGKTAAYKWLILSAGTDPDRIALRDRVAADLQPELVDVIKKQAATWKPQREDPQIILLKRGEKAQ
jgi:TPR repeat protein